MKTAAPYAACLALLAALPVQAQDGRPADGRVWSVSIPKKPDDTAFLSYALPDSDDVGIALSCKVKTGQIDIHFAVDQRLAERLSGQTWVDKIGRRAPWPVSVRLASGLEATTVPGLANPDEMNGGSSVTAELADRAPVIGAFRKTGALRAEAMGTTVEAPPAPGRLVSRFLGACR